MERVIKLHRFKQDDKQTLSRLTVFNDDGDPLFTSLALERGWRDNKQNISCIPAGVYDIILEYSPRFNMDLWEIKGVENRSECKFHSANYWYELNGCIAPGLRASDIDKNGYLDVTQSKASLKELHFAMRPYKKATLIITTETNLIK